MSAHPAKNDIDELGRAASVGEIDHRQEIADRMEALAIELRTMSDRELKTIPSEQTLVSLADKIYSARRRVNQIFSMTGFAVSPGWDMMLDLYGEKIAGRAISVTSACIGGACPPTTGLCWFHALEQMHLIERKQDTEDKRRIVVMLTELGQLKVEQALTCHL